MSTDMAGRPRMLIVEDEAVTAMDLRCELDHLGYDVAGIADNADDATALLGQQDIDVILVDIRLAKGDDGIEFACRIREAHDAAIIFLTAQSDDNTMMRALQATPAGFLVKPFQPRALRHTIEVALEQRRHALERERRLLHLQDRENHLLTINSALTRIASQDALTGLANRRAFDNALDREWRRLSREHRSLSVIMMDVDDFKAYNDLYGHPAGDRVLRQIGGVLAAACQRPGDLACRMGGEEFVMLLPDTSREDALRIAEETLRQVDTLAIPHEASRVSTHVTLSSGIAVALPASGLHADSLVHAADMALYRAKREGRHRVSL